VYAHAAILFCSLKCYKYLLNKAAVSVAYVSLTPRLLLVLLLYVYRVLLKPFTLDD